MTRKRETHTSTGFKNTETNGFFRIAKTDAALAITKRLTASQLRLWLYLMMVDPFADQTDGGELIYHNIPTPAEMAEKIGASVDTVEKDLRTLKKLKLYEYRITGIQGYNSSAEHADVESQRLKQKQTPSKTFPHKDSACLSGTSDYLSPQSAKLSGTSDYLSPQSAKLSGTSDYLSPSQSQKPLQHNNSSTPQTIKTYTDFKKTLSDEERESFLNFVREKTKNFSPQINDIEGWLAKKNEAEQNRWEVYYDLFQRSQPEFVQASQNTKWENHPHRDEWLAEIESSGNPAMFAGSDKEKQAFVKWCWDAKQFSWLKEEGNVDGI